ncbi:MAG: ATP-grasp domain protein [Gemmatimonadetes bacterium]|nr:ATP-grasp domain protein [Gemmatimonadota bacterium]
MKQKRILIVSHPRDLHARATAFAVRKKGHICEEFFCADLPTRTSITLHEGNEATTGRTATVLRRSNEEIERGNRFDTIWLRRVDDAWLPDSMHLGDREVATRHCTRLLWDFLASLDGPSVYWVSHYQRHVTHTHKVYQLREARRAGLAVPRTTVTNDPAEMRAFVEACGGVAAYKLLERASWETADGRRFATYTSSISTADLQPEDTLRLCPAILQPLVEKAFEVRVACFGDHLVALQIDSQSDDRARIDWRMGQWFVDMKPYSLPHAVAESTRRFLRSTGMATASVDFIVTPQGEHVFLEANPQGQFLWLEERASLPLLDIASDYLIAGDPEFCYDREAPAVSWSEYLAHSGDDIDALTGDHVAERGGLRIFADD